MTSSCRRLEVRSATRHRRAGARSQTDLFARPGQYAEVGIPLFWWLDLDPAPRLHALELQDGSEVEVAAVDDEGAVPVPWSELHVDLGPIPER